MVRYLLDTKTFSYIVTGRFPAARARLAGLERHEVACLSAISEGEIRFGAAKQPGPPARRNALEAVLAKLRILLWGSEEADAYGILRSGLEKSGGPLGNLDLLIAAHALAARAILVTNDKAFSHVAHLPIESWAEDLQNS